MLTVSIFRVFSCVISCENSSTEETGVSRDGFNCETIRGNDEEGQS